MFGERIWHSLTDCPISNSNRTPVSLWGVTVLHSVSSGERTMSSACLYCWSQGVSSVLPLLLFQRSGCITWPWLTRCFLPGPWNLRVWTRTEEIVGQSSFWWKLWRNCHINFVMRQWCVSRSFLSPVLSYNLILQIPSILWNPEFFLIISLWLKSLFLFLALWNHNYSTVEAK